MGNLQKSEAQQLRETQLKESLGIGMIFLNRRGEEIIRIKEIFDQQFNEKAPIIKKYRYDRIDNFVERTWTNYGCSDFSELYRSYCDVDFYINDRTDRSNYLGFLPILKTIKKHLLEEQDQEDQFGLMLIGECQKKGLKPKEGLTYERIIQDLIDWWKFKNKWKRPISKNDELAMKMIERRLFAVTNKRKWFK